MKSSFLLHCCTLVLLSACSHEYVVLERKPPDEVAPVDAGDSDASEPDAGMATFDARAPRDDGSAPRDADVAPPDAELGARVVSGFAQTCALLDGALWCWGADNFGQAGVVGMADLRSPVRISQDSFVDVCAGEEHSCALRADGTTLCWGGNGRGQLGVGDMNAREVPTAVENTRRFLALSCGGFNTCALAARGELWCWGDNSEGKLAQGDPPAGEVGTLARSDAPIPVQSDLRFKSVSVGQGHVCAISEQGRLYCWGRNNTGQLGIAEALDQTRAPAAVAPALQFAEVSAGQRHSCAVDSAGKLHCWGQNNDGLLGIGAEPAFARTPVQVGDDDTWDGVSANWLHSCAHKRNGTLSCWGRAEEGQLGVGDTMVRTAPTRLFREDWRAFNAGQFHTCAFAADGLYCWGANDTGQLGFGDNSRRYIPRRVEFR